MLYSFKDAEIGIFEICIFAHDCQLYLVGCGLHPCNHFSPATIINTGLQPQVLHKLGGQSLLLDLKRHFVNVAGIMGADNQLLGNITE
ncbi:hypothetical protein DSECCO2_497360 [anaerobic digester metagenome]